MLFTLGMSYRELNKHFAEKPIEITLSKLGFIELVHSAGIVDKKERAIYKNLEMLEKKKLIVYENKSVRLTPRGNNWFALAASEIEPYIAARDTLSAKDLLQYTKKIKTVLAIK